MASQTPSYGQILSLSYPRTRCLGISPTVVLNYKDLSEVDDVTAQHEGYVNRWLNQAASTNGFNGRIDEVVGQSPLFSAKFSFSWSFVRGFLRGPSEFKNVLNLWAMNAGAIFHAGTINPNGIREPNVWQIKLTLNPLYGKAKLFKTIGVCMRYGENGYSAYDPILGQFKIMEHNEFNIAKFLCMALSFCSFKYKIESIEARLVDSPRRRV